jgi:DNA-binding response OmpR family regulator
MEGGAQDLFGALLLAHGEVDVLDNLKRVFAGRGFRVTAAATAQDASGHLQARGFELVLCAWELPGGTGADVYRRAVAHNLAMRGRFVFLAEAPPDDFQAVVEGRCLCIDPHAIEELVRVVEAAARRARRLARARLSGGQIAMLEADRPRVLVVEDEPLELIFMVRVLADYGFAVTAAQSGFAAIARLQRESFDIVLTDWFMADGSGADLYKWILESQPALAERCVFMSGGSPPDFHTIAPGRALVPKGQDSPQLLETLVHIVEQNAQSRPRA